MEIWLSNGTKDKIQLPINPAEIGQTYNRNFEDITLASGNEKTVISGKSLKEYSISSFFPKRRPVYAEVSKIKTPMEYVKKIESWMDNKKVLLLQVTTTNINKQVTIRSFEWKEVGGAVGDIEYTISLKEYSPVAFSTITASNPKPSKRPAAVKPTVKTYTVKKGDSLWKISKKYYGTGTKWRTIYDKNKKVVGKNPNLIYPGQKLIIP